ncbi:MAG: helix-turn-helix domain-containing protein [Chloroflexota bacterium]
MNRRTLLGAAASAAIVVALPWAAPGGLPARPNWLAVLTARERQFGLLMAQGWTDREIARVFGVSRRTLEVSEAIQIIRREPARHGFPA